ncbi:MAG: trypsin-like serine protease [Planctomycetaceae bacterium]|nr:trypsin-like serine protease [Planctomycetaceae bacterium]
MPELQVRQSGLTGFYAGAIITTVSEPLLITNYDMFGNSVGIKIDPANPQQTADNIQAALSGKIPYNSNGQLTISAGVQYYTPVNGKSDPSYAPIITNVTGPTTKVSLVKDAGGNVLPNVFDITFVDGSGKMDIPELMISSAVDEFKAEYVGYDTASYSVKTLKESSGVFRVNAPEPQNPNSTLPSATNQMNASVAMDADGDFVITWQGEVRGANNTLTTNIYARRFTPQAIQDESKISFYSDGYSTQQYKTDIYGDYLYDDGGNLIPTGQPVQGVRPFADQFVVNEYKDGYQMQPSIGMDRDGNFIIAWADFRQDNSWFSGITAKWYDRDCNVMSSDVRVSPEENLPKTQPSVAISNDGYAVITYYTTLDSNVDSGTNASSSRYVVYAPGYYSEPVAQGLVGGGISINAHVSFDWNNRFMITYTQNHPTYDWIQYSDAYAEIYTIETSLTPPPANDPNDPNNPQLPDPNDPGTDPEPDPETDPEAGRSQSFALNIPSLLYVTVAQTREPFRVSGLDVWTDTDWTWPLPQYNTVGGFDADGDMVFAYQGYGPDFSTGQLLSDTASLTKTINYMKTLINGTKNSDLLMFFNPDNDIVSMYGYGAITVGYTNQPGYSTTPSSQTPLSSYGSVDVDFAIRYYLTLAQKRGASDEQLGRLNAALETVFGTLRGGANDIMTTQINTGNGTGSENFTRSQSSDAIVNSVRDGQNYRMYIAIPKYSIAPVSGGTINLRFWRYSEITGGLTEGNSWVSSSGNEDVALPLEVTNNVFDPVATLNSWGEPGNGVLQNVELFAPSTDRDHSALNVNASVSLLQDSEIMARIGTAWEIPYVSEIYKTQGANSEYLDGYWVYEIVLQAGAHDCEFDYSVLGGTTMSRADLQGNFAGEIQYAVESLGDQGTQQQTPGLHVLPNGSYVVTWATDVNTTTGELVGRNLNYRYFAETQDQAGPMVTDVLLPDGNRLANNQMTTSAVKNVVVTFDEELNAVSDPKSAEWAHSVLNPKNWALIKDGVEIQGAITNIYFGMNQSMQDGFATDGLLSYGTNKWEAVIEFDANGMADGILALGDGQYELVAKSSITDVAGNALNRQGLNVNGSNFSRKFSISVIDGLLDIHNSAEGNYPNYDDRRVNNLEVPGDQNTRDDYGQDTPANPQSVACDDQGNFVAVWTSETGVWAKIYRQEFVTDDYGNRISTITSVKEFHVTAETTAGYASVAMDADGDFVVTWVQDSTALNSKGKVETSKNIFARAYNSDGTARTNVDHSLMGGTGEEKPVNSFTDGIQNYPKIAMDTRGDFVITWESMGQDGSGYGVYYQRYDASGTPLERISEIQAIQFTGRPSTDVSFALEFNFNGVTYKTPKIEIAQNTNITAERIRQALNSLRINVDGQMVPLEVEVEAASSDRILIQFVGYWAGKKMDLIKVVEVNGLKSLTQAITVSSILDGSSGEQQANDTTLGNQRYPSIAMGPLGEFIITWTSWGQEADSAYESNIYAKSFPSNDSVTGLTNGLSLKEIIAPSSSLSQYVLPLGEETPEDFKTLIRPMIVTTDNPANHVIDTMEEEYSGVVLITVGGETFGTGSLLVSGNHILTAAHVVTDALGNAADPADVLVSFELPSGMVTIPAAEIFVHNTYNGDYTGTTDLAIIRLETTAPESVERYDIYRGSGEMSSIVTKVGYGTTGTGATGGTTVDLLKRSGLNRYEANGSIFGTIITDQYFTPNTLVFDFDDGTRAHDALGQLFGLNDLGLGNDEISTAPGDSGGPGFVTDISGNRLIAGVTSYGITLPGNQDFTPGLDSGFGEFAVDVQVSAYADWIDSIVSNASPEYRVNETEIGNQIWSDVAISASGEVIFTWTSYGQDNGGDGPGAYAGGQGGVYARRFDLEGTPARVFNPQTSLYEAAHEFLVNDYILGDQYYSSVDMAGNGDFIITWESYQDRTTGQAGYLSDSPLNYGIYAKRYINTNTFNRTVSQIELTPRYGLPDATYYIAGYGYVGYNGELGGEIHVNKLYLEEDQTGAAVAVNRNGDAVVVFQSEIAGQTGNPGDVVYRLLPLQKDTAPPIVTDVNAVLNKPSYQVDGNGNPVLDSEGNRIPVRDENGHIVEEPNPVIEGVGKGAVLEGSVKQIVITFSEEMYNQMNDPTRITNAANWSLSRNGIVIPGLIMDNIQFGFNMTYQLGLVQSETNKWEAVITFDSSSLPGEQPLQSGTYQLTIKDIATDLEKNKLDGNYDGQAGANFTRTFYILTEDLPEEEDDPNKDPSIPDTEDQPALRNNLFDQNKPAIASRPDGSFVIVGVDYKDEVPVPDGEENSTGSLVYTGSNIVMRTYDKYGNPRATETVVNNYTPGYQSEPDVAMDQFGNIAVVWSGKGEFINSGIFCRIYDSYGMPVSVQFQVNAGYTKEHLTPKAAFDGNGNLVVTWLEYSDNHEVQTIHARVFTAEGQPKTFANGQAEITLVSFTGYSINEYAVSMNNVGNMVLTWDLYNPSTKSNDVYAKVVTLATSGTSTASFSTTLNTFLVNTYTKDNQVTPKAAISDYDSGTPNKPVTFVVTWASEYQDGNNLGIYARRFNLNGQALSILGTTSDARINVVTQYMQGMPDVSVAPNGNFAITWTSYDQEGQNYQTLYQVDPETGLVTGQSGSLIHDNGVFVRAFDGTTGNDISGAVYFPGGSSPEHRVNHEIIGNQQGSVVTMNNDGFSVAWVGPDYIDSYSVTDPTDPEAEPVIVVYSNVTTDIYYRVYRYQAGSGNHTMSGVNSLSPYEYVYAASKSGSGNSGTYESAGVGVSRADNPAYQSLQGTAGDDVVEISITSSGIQVVLNGKKLSVSGSVTNLTFDGLGGNDRITINGNAADYLASLNTEEKSVYFNAKNGSCSLVARNFEDVILNAGGGQSSLSVVTSSTEGAVLEAGAGLFTLEGKESRYRADGFQTLYAESFGSADRVTLYDTVGDDHFEMSPGQVAMTGSGYNTTLVGFKSVTANTARGNDTVNMYGTTGADSLVASANMTSLISGTYRNVAKGFRNVYVNTKEGSDTATWIGTQFDDTYVGTPECSAMVFGGYHTSVTAFGLTKIEVLGGGGHDSATLSGKSNVNNTFVGEAAQAQLTAADYSQTLKGFAKINVLGKATDTATLVRPSNGTNVQTDTDVYSMICDDTELYRLLAFGHVSGKVKGTSGTVDEPITQSTDYLMKIGALR